MSSALPAQRLLALSATDMRQAIPAEELAAALASLPFVSHGRLLNLRDMGAVPGAKFPRGRIYRSGWLKHDASTTEWLGANVKAVFDLRGASEVEVRPDPTVAGVNNVWAPHESPGDDLPVVTSEHFEDGDGRLGWATQYLIYTRTLAPTFRKVLTHLRDRHHEPILFHCTAGRDRSGVLAGLLHHLAGSPPETAEMDYLISRVGIEPRREFLNQYIHRWLDVGDASHAAHINAATLRATTWRAFLQNVQDTYGGWDGYVTDHLGFSEEDLVTIVRNLRTG